MPLFDGQVPRSPLLVNQQHLQHVASMPRCAVCPRWWKLWRSYSRFNNPKDSCRPNDQRQRPGAIDNADLVDSQGQLKGGLCEGRDFVLVGESTCRRLQEWYVYHFHYHHLHKMAGRSFSTMYVSLSRLMLEQVWWKSRPVVPCGFEAWPEHRDGQCRHTHRHPCTL